MVLARIALQAALACVQTLAEILVMDAATIVAQVALVVALEVALVVALEVAETPVLEVAETDVHRRVEPAMGVLPTAGAVVVTIVGVQLMPQEKETDFG